MNPHKDNLEAAHNRIHALERELEEARQWFEHGPPPKKWFEHAPAWLWIVFGVLSYLFGIGYGYSYLTRDCSCIWDDPTEKCREAAGSCSGFMNGLAATVWPISIPIELGSKLGKK